MDIEVSFFGQLTDITRCSVLSLKNPGTVEELKKHLLEIYPGLNYTKFAIAVNNKIVQDNLPITDHSKIALMPPFSGG